MQKPVKDWKSTVQTFLKRWKDTDTLVAVLACGSYVTGNPSTHSDIDLHLILPEGTNWRERGNIILDGILIEYFANPPQQIKAYFKEDYTDGNYMSPTQFLTGLVIFDKIGIIPQLQKVAQTYKDKAFPRTPAPLVELQKYSLWDTLDNVQDSYERKSKDFFLVYYTALHHLYETYAKYLRYPVSGFAKVYDTLTNNISRKKYLLTSFPDTQFVTLFEKAIQLQDTDAMTQSITSLTEYVLKKMGGLQIDGWKLRSPLSL